MRNDTDKKTLTLVIKRARRAQRGTKLKQRIALNFQVPESLFDPCRLLRVRQVALLLSVHEQTIWKWQRTGKIPRPLQIGDNTTAWRAIDIAEWLATKVKAADQ
jgi:predicted DNA-binding transcriptional regulator AlpA